MDLSTALSLNYGHVKEELDKNRIPLLIHLERKKSNTTYRTCLGFDAVSAIKLYLHERSIPRYRCKTCSHTWTRKRLHCALPNCTGEVVEYAETLTYDSPLFMQTHHTRRLRGNELMALMRQYVIRSGLLPKERINRANKNPAGTHALRSAMSSILQFHGINQEVINGFLGHRVAYDSAYSRLGEKELLEIYSGVAKHLSVTGAEDSSDVLKEVRNLKEEMAKSDHTISKLMEMNQDLEKRMKEMEVEQNELQKERVKALDVLSKYDTETVEMLAQVIDEARKKKKRL